MAEKEQKTCWMVVLRHRPPRYCCCCCCFSSSSSSYYIRQTCYVLAFMCLSVCPSVASRI